MNNIQYIKNNKNYFDDIHIMRGILSFTNIIISIDKKIKFNNFNIVLLKKKILS